MISVIGLDGSELAPGARARLAAAAVVAGGHRHLESLAGLVPTGARVVPLGVDLRGCLELACAAGSPLVVLASGDPGYFGVLRILREVLTAQGPAHAPAVARTSAGASPGEAGTPVASPERPGAVAGLAERVIEVWPAVSAVATLAARVGLPWDDCPVVSAHGRSLHPVVAAALAYPKVAVLTGPGSGPAELGAQLTAAGAGSRTFVVGERLGYPEERVSRLTARAAAGRRWADLATLLVLADSDTATPAEPGSRQGVGAAGSAPGPRWAAGPPGPSRPGWALPVTAFVHRDGMVTKPAVRAVALAALGPRLGQLIWDVGTGSGSVAVECARLGAATVAVDRDPQMLARVRANAAAHRVLVNVVEGVAPEVLTGLPDPDAVFIGGSGGQLAGVLAAVAPRARRAVVLALAGLDRVTPAVGQLRAAGYAAEATLVSAAQVVPIGDSQRLSGENPVFLVVGQR